MKTIREIEQNVDLIELDNGKKIFLIGTAHVSTQSADLVEAVIRREKPDTVCLELCDGRFQSLQNPNRWREMDLYTVIRSGRAYLLMAQLALAGFQRKIAKQFGIKPGEEMHRAIKLTQDLQIRVSLVDRDVKTTLKRAWAKARWWTLIKLFFSLIFSAFRGEEVAEKDIEELKKGDVLSAALAEFSELLPGLKDALIDERDMYMAEKIRTSEGNTLVAVVGAGHGSGIKHWIDQPIDLAELEKVPPPSMSSKILGWSVPALVVGLFVYGFFAIGKGATYDMMGAWIVTTGTFSALGALVALAHPLTILTAFVAAPITTLHPFLAAGWACGLVEALIRKPRVADLESIADDVTSIRGIWKNRASKVLLIVATVNLGASIGAVIGFGRLASLLS